jgi:hypothetical protein
MRGYGKEGFKRKRKRKRGGSAKAPEYCATTQLCIHTTRQHAMTSIFHTSRIANGVLEFH